MIDIKTDCPYYNKQTSYAINLDDNYDLYTILCYKCGKEFAIKVELTITNIFTKE